MRLARVVRVCYAGVVGVAHARSLKHGDPALGNVERDVLELFFRAPQILIEPCIASVIQMAERSAKDRRARHGKIPRAT